ncbi:hypothetical protein [Cerasicoccus frondis]|uniref:hypothetical protein n=1 Tax=Cerasicoccus frondis TaxID=490090 RepID=UPI002852C184|nr:hypothetical protein [Cerasicoccus frondis]
MKREFEDNPYPETGYKLFRDGTDLVFYPDGGYFPCRCVKTNAQEGLEEVFETAVDDALLRSILGLFIPRRLLSGVMGENHVIMQIYLRKDLALKRKALRFFMAMSIAAGVLLMVSALLGQSLLLGLVSGFLFLVFIVLRRVSSILRVNKWKRDRLRLTGAGLLFVETLQREDSNKSPQAMPNAAT